MAALNTGSLIAPPGVTDIRGVNRTGTAVSTNIIIKVDDEAIGAIKSISVDETRAIQQIDEVGTDGHIDSVPKSSVNIKGNCTRTRFDGLRMAHAFKRGYIHVASQRIPFDITIIDIFAGEDEEIVTVIKNVWITNLKVEYKSDDFVIVDTMGFEAEAVFSVIGSGSAAVSPSGGRSVTATPADQFELAADIGNRRGALDGAGLLNAVEKA